MKLLFVLIGFKVTIFNCHKLIAQFPNFDQGKGISFIKDTTWEGIKKMAIEKNIVEYKSLIESFEFTYNLNKKLGELALYAKNVLQSRELSIRLSSSYRSNYLINASDDEILTKDNLYFLEVFPASIIPGDQIFNSLYNNIKKCDSIISKKGWTEQQLLYSIIKNSINPLIARNINFNSGKSPKWNVIQKNLNAKYPKLLIDEMILKQKIKYYRFVEINWHRWAKIKSQKIRKYPPINGINIYVELNVNGTWDAFLNCSNRTVLKKTLRWINLAISSDDSHLPAYYDTKANVLYKLGRNIQAIKLQRLAVQIAKQNANKQGVKENGEVVELSKTLKLMESGSWKN